ncbi:MAG: TOBE domain-containing protein [Eudoraea sp.]|nr:TOBE domain-containing protein [Eudoraea sp.]
MNSFTGHIVSIEESEKMSLVTVSIGDDLRMKAIILETSETASYLKLDNPIRVLFKETEVVIGTAKPHQISLQNRIPGTVSQIEKSGLLSKITVQSNAGDIVSIISTQAIMDLDIQEGSSILAMIKLNEVMLSLC